MDFDRKPAPTPVPKRATKPVRITPGPLQRQRLKRHKTEDELNRFTARPVALQRQVARPLLAAAALRRQEETRLISQRMPLQRQVAELSASLPGGAVQAALQRQVAAQTPEPLPTRPQHAAEWVTVMRARAQQVDGQRLSAKQAGEFTALQRQVAAVVAQTARQGSPAAFTSQVVALQRHPLSAPVARAALNLVPAGQRLSLQRAVDEAVQTGALEREQDQQALLLHSLQRQLADLDNEATQPVMQRIEARRGAGSPLPEAVRQHLEQGLNHDLSGVRIHADAEADKLAKNVGALAFTTGTDIYFRSGQFNPNTRTGLELLAHEVTHTVQQSQGRVGPGVDPDAGLETEARAMGQRLARQPAHGPRFGTRARRPGHRTVPRPSLQRVAAGPDTSVQRFGLGDLKKLAGAARSAVSGRVQSVAQKARQTLQATAQNMRKAAAPAIKKAQDVVQHVRVAAGRVVQTTRQRIQRAGKTVREYAGHRLAALQRTARQVKASARRTVTGLGRKIRNFGQRTARSFQKVRTSVSRKIGAVAQKVGLKARDTLADLQKTARSQVEKARAKAAELRQGAQAALARVRHSVQQTGAKLRSAFHQAVGAARKAATRGWNTAVRTAGGLKDRVAGTVNAIKNHPRVQATARFLKEAGIQVAKVGAAIVVGGSVIAGAAALTVATGGLAGPALVGALFVSGALGGAAAQVVDNALRGKKNKFDGISAKSILVDGALGVALGPLSKVAGGVVRAVGKPILNVAGRGLSAAARGAGGLAARGLNAAHPALMPALRLAAGRTGTGVAALASRVAGLPAGAIRALATSRPAGVARHIAGRVGSGLRAVGTRLAGSRAGRALNRLDSWSSAGFRGVASVPGKVGTAGRSWLDRTRLPGPWTRGVRKLRAVGEKFKDSLAVKGIRLRGRLTDSGSRGWIAARRNITEFERTARIRLSSYGMNVNTTSSMTHRAFDAAERALVSMKSYAAAESRALVQEVRDQWFGAAGVGGVLRTNGKMQELLVQNPALATAWNREKERARHALVNAAARAMRNEAKASGSQLSRAVSRHAAASRVTDDMIHEYAVRNATGRFMTRATQAYRGPPHAAGSGFDSQQNWLAQLPRIYAAGGRQMGRDALDKLRALQNAGGLAAATATSGGWISEEFLKTYTAGAAEQYKKAPGLAPTAATHQAGMTKLESDWKKNLVTANTGLIPEAQGGKLWLGAPYDRFVKTQATIGGTSGTTVSNELQYTENP